ncbi:class I SAM-dependent methyltransferase [Sideroxydans sp. CL21]|uniref:class I SAM-dependent methyltransferase n=1 Tax=Sideroxydans sp. CL21 TaxID=2600596 RepID=UPI0024BC2DBB|nr:class I SAM-dependent methyltransferase [Sideroxydans sp. CL21]
MQAGKEHWETVYTTKATDEVSWFQPHAQLSLDLIKAATANKDAGIIDVGGGASTLVDDLLAEGYRDLTVLDLSAAALHAARQRLGMQESKVRWIEADITDVDLPGKRYDVWHDRAVFHFLTTPQQRDAYVRTVFNAVKPGGHVIVATFAEDGPQQCSGLPVMRYRADELHDQFGDAFTLLKHQKEEHHTPAGKVQKFVYCYCRRINS